MTTRRELPADVAAAFERVPEGGDRFAALPGARQAEWLQWIDRGRGRRGRAARIDEMVRRLLPSAAAAEEEVAEPVGPPPERYWWVGVSQTPALRRRTASGCRRSSSTHPRQPCRTSSASIRRRPRVPCGQRAASPRPQPGHTDQSKDGLVIDEQPKAGSSIPGGSQVTIFVGRFSR